MEWNRSVLIFRLDTMSNEYMRKKLRLKRQWSYIEAALKLVQLTEQSEKKRALLDAITKSDSVIFDQLLDEEISLLDGPIPSGYNYSNLYQIIIERSTNSFIDRIFSRYNDRLVQPTDGGKTLVPVACERGKRVARDFAHSFRFSRRCHSLRINFQTFPTRRIDRHQSIESDSSTPFARRSGSVDQTRIRSVRQRNAIGLCRSQRSTGSAVDPVPIRILHFGFFQRHGEETIVRPVSPGRTSTDHRG